MDSCAPDPVRLSFRGYLRVALLCAAHFGALAQRGAPECFPGGHRILRNPYRSVDFDSTEIQNTAIQELVCDHSLAPGWYRFKINNKPAEMPTTCVEMNRCGTQAPVWLSLREAPLPRPGEVRQLSACATWQFFHGSTKDCCLFRIPITVRNCGSFLLYYLQPTQGCMGYCAKVVPDVGPRPCPAGEVEVDGRCSASLPSLPSRPTISPELFAHSVHLRCSFVPPPWNRPLGYRVVWARNIGRGMKAEIRQETTLKPFSLVEMDGLHFRLGETYSCSVSTFSANSSAGRSTPRESESFYAGLKFSPESLHIAEDGREHKVAVHSTVPIACYHSDHCGVPLALSVHDPDSLPHEVSNVALSACQVELRPAACGDGSCSRAAFLLTAVTDFTRDGNRPSLVTASPAAGVPRLWRNYIPLSLKVTVQDVPTSICYSLTDPHIITLDGRRYENHQTGTFVLYRSLARDFEVHSRQWDCGSRHYGVACSCGVAAREGNDVAVFDMCNGQPQEARAQLSLKVLGDGDGKGSRVRVLESHQGKKVTLIFPSGAFVRADVGGWGMSLSIRAPSIDYGNTRGLCGTFDRNGNNDFQDARGGSYGPDDLNLFIEDWRIAAGESLFDKLPPGRRQEDRRPFCLCQKGLSTTLHASRGMRNLYDPSAHSDCVAYDNVDYTSVFPSMDTTREYLQSEEREESILNMSSSRLLKWRRSSLRQDELDSELREDLLLSMERPKRQAVSEFQPVFAAQSLRQADLESFAYFFPEDHLAEARPQVRPRWPTPSGLTSGKALEVCQAALAGSTVGTVCRGLLGRRLDEAVDLCILDLQLKDDLAWDEELLPYLENECERRLLENRTRRAAELVGGPGASGEVLTALRCPNFCNGNGECTEWGCQCRRSFSSYDCSLAISQPVELTDIENGGLCDIRAFDCRSVRVFGLGFVDSPDLSCHATRLKYMNGVWVQGEKQRSKASFLSSKALDCNVPVLSSTAINTEEFMMDDKPYARWELKVTNDGSQYSRPKVVTIYDGVCQVCDASRSGLCKLKDRTCNIDGMCFAEGDPNPGSPCLLCDPDSSQFTWSVNQVNEPPAFHRPLGDLRTFAGENFVFQFAASDPEGSALLFQLEDGPQGAVLSPAGLLIWRVPPLPDGKAGRSSRSFRFTLSDECDAQSSFTVQIVVVPCGCQNGGSCVTDINFPAGSGRYLCVCPEGHHGDLCERDVDECASSPCAAGTCVDTAGGFTCECPAGLRGERCLQDVDECEGKPCFPGVECFNSPGSFSCGPCPEGKLGNGTSCWEATRPVSSTAAPPATVQEVPRVLMQPPDVEASIPKTEPDRVSTEAVTSDHRRTIGLPEGQTLMKESGNSVNQAESDAGSAPPVSATCASRPCFPGVQCINRRPPHVGYVCGRCPPGLHGNGRTCMKNAKAASGLLPHQQTAAKSGRSPQVFRLHLPSLPSLPGRRAVAHLSSLGPKTQGGAVTRQAAAVAAITGRGGGTGRREAITAAVGARDPSRTSINALRVTNVWVDRRWSAMTTRGVNKVTPAAPRLLTQPVSGGNSKEPTVLQTNLLPRTPPRPAPPLTAALAALSYSLSEADFSADGEEGEAGSSKIHVVIRPMESGGPLARTHSCADRPCFPGSACQESPDGGVRCGRCPVGYIGDGRSCRAVCKHTCGRNMECAAPNTCRCKAGYAGVDCQTAICDPECVNGGICVAPSVCQCPRGFHGESCQEALCRWPCENGGSCVGLQTCSCPYGFVGPRCETMVCSRHCHNGGQCASPDECLCPAGWTGPSCETALCSPVCLNGGSCVRPGACECPPGFYGDRCQNAVCSPPCKNGGVCMRNNVCSCLQGYTGGRCEKSVCESMCMNGGRCVGPDVCDCPSGWRGKRCDKPSCLHKCLNGGECVGPNTCHCAPGWQGMLCQTPHCDRRCLYGSRCVRPNQCACPGRHPASLCVRKLQLAQG